MTSRISKVIGLVLLAFAAMAEAANKPNFVIIFTDDQGYGDLSCFNGKHVNTPTIDRLAKEGAKLTSFYVAAPVCTPSRAALMTGCYPKRVNMATGSKFGVLLAGDKKGLNPKETTIAEVLKSAGYVTGMFGKWHLGDQPEFLPTRQGFDEYFGIPYSHDIHPFHPAQKRYKFPPLPLLDGEKVIEADPDADHLTRRITERAVNFIEKNHDNPFFVYVPHPIPHRPLHVSPPFMKTVPDGIQAALEAEGNGIDYKTRDRMFRQAIDEIDWSVDQIVQTLKKHKLDRNTLVIVTSDNGPAIGSAGPLRGRKGSTFEGGMREATVAWWPGKIPAGSVNDELMTAMDLLPTFAKLAGADLPKVKLDGKDVMPVLAGRAKSPHDRFFYHGGSTLKAVRSGKWKLHVAPAKKSKKSAKTSESAVQLYDLSNDIGEKNNVAKSNADVVRRLRGYISEFNTEVAANVRPAAFLEKAKPLVSHDGKVSRSKAERWPAIQLATAAPPTNPVSSTPTDLPATVPGATKRPNYIVIMVDDVGYGDIGRFGGKRAPTAHLDQMAKEGMRFADFYVHPVCGVTRAAFMTGSYAMRAAEVGNRKNGHPVLHPKEDTIAEVMRDAGYKTGMIGKWHLCGNRRTEYPPELMPNAQGFDYFYGAPLHNGFTRTIEGSKFRMQLMRQNKVLDQSIDQEEMDQITKWYTEEAVKFIEENADKGKPFFLFVAHSMAHVVIGATEKFRGKSGGGLYGDTIEELDWSTGEILKALKEAGIDGETLVVFTSDNGPWVEDHLKGEGGKDTHYGSSGPLRGFKMTTWEGGVRVPTIVRWPGKVPAGATCREPVTIMDLLPTFAKLGGGAVPTDRVIDGRDITSLLRGEPGARSPHEAIYHYSFVHLQAVRAGKWKLVVPRPAKPKYTLWSARMTDAVTEVSLYDLHADLGETTNVAKDHPEEVRRLIKLLDRGREDIGDYNTIGKGARFFDDGPRRTESRKWLFPSAGERSVPDVDPRQDAKPGTVGSVPPRYDGFKPIGNLRFDFESGDLQGWKVVEGDFDQVLSDRPCLPKWKRAPFNRQGGHHLSTAAKQDGSASDRMTGVIESPRFRLDSPRVSFLVSGGNRNEVHLAICRQDGEELLRTGGEGHSQMVRRTLDLSEHVGTTVFIRVVDRAQERWGHITFDDFSCAGRLVTLQDASPAATPTGRAGVASERAAPTITHSFLATGSHTYIVDESGKKVWQYPRSTRDGYVLPSGDIVLTLSKTRGKNSPYPGGGVVIVDRKGKVLFEYKGEQSEVNSAHPVGEGNLVLTEAGPNPRLREINRQGRVVVEFPLACQKGNHHMQTRMARKLEDGTYLAPHLLDFAVKHYDRTGKVLQVFDTTVAGDPGHKIHTWPFTAIRLPTRRTLVSCTHGNRVVEFDSSGKIVWELTNEDLPGPWLQDPCGAQVLPNGNVVITSYAAGRRDPKAPKLIEVTRDKKVVWTYRDGQGHGIHHFQILTTQGKPVAWPPNK